MAKPRFLFASANPSADHADLRMSLDTEYEFLRELLDVTNALAFPYLEPTWVPRANRDKILSFVDNPALREDICFFHFAGHGQDGDIYFQNAEGGEETTRLEGLGPILNEFSNLKLVFLNCCTSENLARYIASPERIVIAAPVKVPTYQAMHFAREFYNLLLKKNPIYKAFEVAIAKVRAIPNDELRAVFDIEEDEEEDLPHLADVFKIYPSPDAIGAQDRLMEITEYFQTSKQGRALIETNPQVKSKLYEPVLKLNYFDQMKEYQEVLEGDNRNVMAFLVQGPPESGIPLIHHRFLRDVVTEKSLRMTVNLNKRSGATDAEVLWTQLAKTVGLSGELADDKVAEAVFSVLDHDKKDIFISLFNAQHNGPEGLKSIAKDFWFRLLEAMGYNLLMAQKKLWLLLYVEDELHAEKTLDLADMGGEFSKYLTSISPLGLFEDAELSEVLYYYRQILEVPLRSRTKELSKMIIKKSNGIPLKVLEELCKICKADLAILTQQLKAI